MIDIIVNGNTESIEIMNMSDYLLSKKIDKERVIVELNGKIIKKEDLGNVIINKNDKIEVIRFIGGG